MKSKLLVPLVFAFLVFSFAFKSPSPKDKVLNFIDKEYVRSSDSEALKSIMKTNFCSLFDEIDRINIHSNQEDVYYYAVYGTKDNNDAVELFKTSKENIDNDVFPLLEMSASSSAGDIYCYWQIEQERCGFEPDWISIRCGLASKGCLSF